MMKKEELRTGDIIVNRDGYLGVVLKEEDYILYQEIGMDWLDEFNEDLTFNDDDYRDGDIMQVFRGCTFIDLDDNYPHWERDEQWSRPTEEERKEREAQLERQRQEYIEIMRQREAEMAEQIAARRKDLISIVTQHFYGNRTGTEIRRDRADHFLRGYIDNSYGPEVIEDAVRKTVRVPGSEHIVIVYDQTEEDQYVNVEFPELYARNGAKYREHTGKELTMTVSCEIPEIGFKIHTRCFACRIDENGVLQSLEAGDEEKFIHYFPVR